MRRRTIIDYANISFLELFVPNFNTYIILGIFFFSQKLSDALILVDKALEVNVKSYSSHILRGFILLVSTELFQCIPINFG